MGGAEVDVGVCPEDVHACPGRCLRFAQTSSISTIVWLVFGMLTNLDLLTILNAILHKTFMCVFNLGVVVVALRSKMWPKHRCEAAPNSDTKTEA